MSLITCSTDVMMHANKRKNFIRKCKNIVFWKENTVTQIQMELVIYKVLIQLIKLLMNCASTPYYLHITLNTLPLLTNVYKKNKNKIISNVVKKPWKQWRKNYLITKIKHYSKIQLNNAKREKCLIHLCSKMNINSILIKI